MAASGQHGFKALSCLILSFCCAVLDATSPYSSLDEVPMGCFNYGYVYSPAMTNVTQPVIADSPMTCQQRCRETEGCARFGFWETGLQCWLGDANSQAVVSKTLGGISGPAHCSVETVSCTENDIPTARFPGQTAEESRSGWPTGQQPTNLQCWPRKSSGFPASCSSAVATVLQDTLLGWPGRCEGMTQITNLESHETCQTRCFASPLCGIWAEENSTNLDGSLTCWQGMFGQNCYNSANGLSPPIGSYFRAQRVMHGTFRVLMNMAGMHMPQLRKIFGIELHPDWKEGAKACRMTCLSYLLCQYWQYSDVYGCSVQDDMVTVVSYPLVSDNEMLKTGDFESTTVKAGEYIQHLCVPGPPQPLPTDPPVPVGSSVATPTEAPSGGSTGEATVRVGDDKPYPMWAKVLIGVTLALCLGVVGATVIVGGADAERRKNRRKFQELLELNDGGSPGGSKEESFDSRQPLREGYQGYGPGPSHTQGSGIPLPGGLGNLVNSAMHRLHLDGQQHDHGGYGGGYPQDHGYYGGGFGGSMLSGGGGGGGGYSDPRYAGLNQGRGGGGYSRDQLMQYAHQGY